MAKATCKEDDCDSPVVARGWCAAHYHRVKRYGSPQGGKTRRKTEAEKQALCSEPNCTRTAKTRGVCDACYVRLRSKGQLPNLGMGGELIPLPGCSVEDCSSVAYGRGLCLSHWAIERRLGDPLALSARRMTLIERVRRFAPEGEPDNCWPWTGGQVDKDGYGHLGTKDGRFRVHRVAWEHANGMPVPSGLLIRHTCDNPPCTNPAHLLLGTVADNSADAIERDRIARGERSGNAKLTGQDVLAIRAAFAANPADGLLGLANRFKISNTHVKRIVERDSWKHI